MKYFVSIENTSYFHWQIELLIESFKKHGLENDLIITIAENRSSCIPGYNKNLLSHKNKHVHAPITGPKCANKIWALLWLLENGQLKPPFTIIHPDMILLRPVESYQDELVFDNNQRNFPEEVYAVLENVIKQNDLLSFPLPIVGSTIIVNDIKLDLLAKVWVNIQELGKLFGESVFWNMEQIAWTLTLFEEILMRGKKISLRTETLEQTLLHHNVVNNFIHYNHGIPPAFSKYYYKYKPPIALVPNDLPPFEAIYLNNITPSTDYVCKLIETYRDRVS